MTHQERTLFWPALAVLCAIALVAEYLLASDSLIKPITMLGCAAVIGYAFYRSLRRNKRHPR